MKFKIFVSFSIFLFWLTPNGSAQDLPDGFTDELLAINLIKPIGIEFTSDGTGFIWEKSGRVWALDTLDQLSTDPIINIGEEVAVYGDHGLVNIALDPNFLDNGFIYLLYGVDRHYLLNFGSSNYDPDLSIENQASLGRVTRFTLDPNDNFKLVDNSRLVLLGKNISDGLPILMISHCTGDLAFGQDKTLLISSGESASFTQADQGDATDTYHEQAIADGIMEEKDNVGSYRSMLLDNPMGKILRIDPQTGAGIPSNPFYDSASPNSAKSKVWALGFRNPYKLIHIPNTGSHNPEAGDPGHFIVGDVGGGLWEEINVVTEPAQWYGWPMYEGMHGSWEFHAQNVVNEEAPNPLTCGSAFFNFQELYADDFRPAKELFNPCDANQLIPNTQYTYRHTRPLMSYSNVEWNQPNRNQLASHNSDGVPVAQSVINPQAGLDTSELIIGGAVIPGTFNAYDQFPDEYRGSLFFGDFYGSISELKLDTDYKPSKLLKFLESDKGITNVQFAPHNGCLYYFNIIEKEIHRICFEGVLPPEIIVTQDKNYGPSPLVVNFDASQTISHSGTALSYEWDFNDGIKATGPVVNHSFVASDARSFVVGLKVTDGIGKVARASFLVSVNNTPPLAEITSVVDGATYAMNDYTILPLKATASDLEFEASELSYEWWVDFYHDSHFHEGNIDTKMETFAFIDPLGCGIEQYSYRINLRVTDPAGLSTMDYAQIYPYCGPPFAEFTSFDAVYDGVQNVNLDWSLGLEEDLSHFEIERTDGYLFVKIGTVDIVENFSFVDTQPFLGRNFYRIRAVNNSGDYTFSEIAIVDILPEVPFVLFPNPATDFLDLEVFPPEHKEIGFQLFSMQGKLLQEEKFSNDGMSSFNTRIDISNLPTGVYNYLITLDDQSYYKRIAVF